MSDTAKEYRAAKGSVLRAPEALWNSWQHQIDPGVNWTEATRREYWANLVERFRSGDVVEIHSFDHRYRFNMLIHDVNTAADPVYFDISFQPIYPVDLRLPEAPAQRAPRYVTRQAPGAIGFNVVDLATGTSVRENPTHYNQAVDLAATLERAASEVERDIALAGAKTTHFTNPAPRRGDPDQQY